MASYSAKKVPVLLPIPVVSYKPLATERAMAILRARMSLSEQFKFFDHLADNTANVSPREYVGRLAFQAGMLDMVELVPVEGNA